MNSLLELIQLKIAEFSFMEGVKILKDLMYIIVQGGNTLCSCGLIWLRHRSYEAGILSSNLSRNMIIFLKYIKNIFIFIFINYHDKIYVVIMGNMHVLSYSYAIESKMAYAITLLS
jgi:hypothetical protein